MTRRQPTSERKDQIIAAVLELLASRRWTDISTRDVAAHVGVSQPALFRHFPSRDNIMIALLQQQSDALSVAARELLAKPVSWSDGCLGLARLLLEHVAANPGLARLYISDRTLASPHGGPLGGVAERQVALVNALVVQGQTNGELSQSIDAKLSAELYVAALHGAVLRWMLPTPQPSLAIKAIELWEAALRAGYPAGDGVPLSYLSGIDVRPIVAAGQEPLDAILAAVSGVRQDGALVLWAPFRPRPLIKLLEGRSWRVQPALIGDRHWELLICGAGCPALMDLTELEAPEPLEAVLMASSQLQAGGALLARVPQMPRMLFPRLADRQLRWATQRCADSTVLIHVHAAS